ncbi:MAG: hypothetical protein PHV61_11550 [Limnochordia bacterium]|jgi:hypothetical protein|nr:hypothetical protein [Limnochordia bacterium]MDD4517576.1 hypothetical protein [Limnochordia bacterium]
MTEIDGRAPINKGAFQEARYLETALANMNYELGINAQSYVQITGLGSRMVMDLADQQHRFRSGI